MKYSFNSGIYSICLFLVIQFVKNKAVSQRYALTAAGVLLLQNPHTVRPWTKPSFSRAKKKAKSPWRSHWGVASDLD